MSYKSTFIINKIRARRNCYGLAAVVLRAFFICLFLAFYHRLNKERTKKPGKPEEMQAGFLCSRSASSYKISAAGFVGLFILPSLGDPRKNRGKSGETRQDSDISEAVLGASSVIPEKESGSASRGSAAGDFYISASLREQYTRIHLARTGKKWVRTKENMIDDRLCIEKRKCVRTKI